MLEFLLQESEMSSEQSQVQQMKPYIIIAAVLFVVLLAVVLWPSSDDASEQDSVQNNTTVAPVSEPANALSDNQYENDMSDDVAPDVFQAPQQPEEVRLGDTGDIEEFVAEEVEVEIPIDASDASVKTALLSVAKSPMFGKLLVNDSLIQKFVINVSNLADEELTIKDSLVVPPEGTFKTYEQADAIWIDKASFARYTPYVEVLESMEVEELLSIYDTYKDTIDSKFAEISRPGTSFDSTLIDAINEILDTPEVPMPIEIYSESVNYKFKDPRLEALPGPQKQLLRTGPENMRRIKDVLRAVKSELEDRE